MAVRGGGMRASGRGSSGVPELRPMGEGDVEAVLDLAALAFSDLDERIGRPSGPPRDRATALIRFRQPLRTDPGGAWVAQRGRRLVGAAEAIVREGVWGLSLLVVHPDEQSAGIGRALLHRALEYAGGG